MMKKDFNQSAFHPLDLTAMRSTIEALLGLKTTRATDYSVKPIERVLTMAKLKFGERQQRVIDCDRVFVYNPDAIGEWIMEKHPDHFREAMMRTDLTENLSAVYPPVTPVCFASMYSGMTPEEHGIRKYEKPVLKVNTLFDDLAAAGKKVAIVCTAGDSIAEIFKERDIDYYIYEDRHLCNLKALELIEEDRHDLIVLYNGNYDWAMHRFGPEGRRSMKELSENVDTFCKIHDAIEKQWKNHNTVLFFSPDHGCHRSLLPPGKHGARIPKDMNIRHLYSFLCRENDEN